MRNKYERSVGLRLLSSVAAIAFIITIIFTAIVGFNAISTILLIASIGSVAGQAIYVGESFIECITSFFEIFLESIASIFEAIASIFNI